MAYEHDGQEPIVCVDCGSTNTDFTSDNGSSGDNTHFCGLKCRDCGHRWSANVYNYEDLEN